MIYPNLMPLFILDLADDYFPNMEKLEYRSINFKVEKYTIQDIINRLRC